MKSQVDLLADWILVNVPGEPSQSEGAGECAIRIMQQQRATIQQLEARVKEAEALYADSCSALNAHMGIHAQVVNRVKELESIAPPCRWYQNDAGSDAWRTACGGLFSITNGTPQENKMSWCCYCGGKLEESLDTDPDSA
jgi:hypothetical protein